MNKNIRFTIFNEEFWGKGLIYSQNLLPLIKLSKDKKNDVQILAFTSILDLFLFRKEIFKFKKEFNDLGIRNRIYPILFVRSRFFILRWFMFPLLIVTTLPYILYFNFIDLINNSKQVVYHLRAYTTSFLFAKFYYGKAMLVFDPRSDFIIENRRLLNWKENSTTDKLWRSIEKRILEKCDKSIFISDEHRLDTLSRNNILIDTRKHVIFSNPIDFKQFETSFKKIRTSGEIRFLYTGSLGNWNSLEVYLDFFKGIKSVLPKSTMYVITSTRNSKIKHVIEDSKFKKIIDDVHFFYNLPYNELPELYKDCTAGLQLMKMPDSRLGVKYVEYLASGLIPIVNYNVRGAAQFCRQGLGLVLEDEVLNYSEIANDLRLLINSDFKNLISKAKNTFDVNESYKLLNRIYRY